MKVKKPVLAVDWNNTIQDMISEIIHRTQLDFNVELQLADFSVWDAPLGDRLGLSHQEWVEYAWLDKNCQWDAKPYPMAANAIGILKHWYEIVILTATCHPDLVESWMLKHRVYYDRIEISEGKLDCEWDILIDDNPKILNTCIAAGRQVVKRHLPWNTEIYLPTLYDWGRTIWLDRLITLAGGEFNGIR